MSALAAISSRPEFLSEIAPKVEHTSDGIRLHFNMFYKGNPVIVTVDDKLPFFKRSSGKELSLVYATSKNDEKFYLAAFFEKAVVKQACFRSYDLCDAIHAEFVFSLLSDCVTNCCFWSAKESKKFVTDCLKFEIDHKSSTILTVVPHFSYKPEETDEIGHAFVVLDYDTELESVELYNQSTCQKRWITLDQL